MSSSTAMLDGKDAAAESNQQENPEEQIAKRVSESSYAALRNVTVDHDGEVVTLRGEVPSYFLKQIAQSIAHDVAGIRRVVNNLEVCNASTR